MEQAGQIIFGFLLGLLSQMYFCIFIIIVYFLRKAVRATLSTPFSAPVIIGSILLLGYLIQVLCPFLLANHPSLIATSQSFGIAFVVVLYSSIDWKRWITDNPSDGYPFY